MRIANRMDSTARGAKTVQGVSLWITRTNASIATAAASSALDPTHPFKTDGDSVDDWGGKRRTSSSAASLSPAFARLATDCRQDH